MTAGILDSPLHILLVPYVVEIIIPLLIEVSRADKVYDFKSNVLREFSKVLLANRLEVLLE